MEASQIGAAPNDQALQYRVIALFATRDLKA
jgi:hypothetical protein